MSHPCWTEFLRVTLIDNPVSGFNAANYNSDFIFLQVDNGADTEMR